MVKKKDKNPSIKELLEDLSTLEINTIIKDGMLATPSKKGNYDLILDVFNAYTYKYHMVIKEHESIKAEEPNGRLSFKRPGQDFEPFNDESADYENWGNASRPASFLELRERLLSLNRIINQDKSLWFSARNFTVLKRIASFCTYVERLNCPVKVIKKEKSFPKDFVLNEKVRLYNLPISHCEFDFEPVDEVKIKRMRDLGTETILMQTRIGLDGDVVTRIEKDFTINGGSRKFTESQAELAKSTIIKMHEKHIDISLKYWNSLVTLVKDFFTGLVKSK